MHIDRWYLLRKKQAKIGAIYHNTVQHQTTFFSEAKKYFGNRRHNKKNGNLHIA